MRVGQRVGRMRRKEGGWEGGGEEDESRGGGKVRGWVGGEGTFDLRVLGPNYCTHVLECNSVR